MDGFHVKVKPEGRLQIGKNKLFTGRKEFWKRLRRLLTLKSRAVVKKDHCELEVISWNRDDNDDRDVENREESADRPELQSER